MFLQEYLKKEYAWYTRRGNASIQLALQAAKTLGYKHLYLQDQGGWITYEQFGKKYGFTVSFLSTDYGVLHHLPQLKPGILLINALPAYALHQPMHVLYEEAKQQDIFLITDLAGGIAYPELLQGDILIGSFGRWKPLNVLEGGFLATNNKAILSLIEEKNTYLFPYEKELQKKWESLPERINRIKERKRKLLKDFQSWKERIITDDYGFNVIIRYEDEKEKQTLLAYAEKENIPTVICPQYIKVLAPAVSFEIKRLF